MADGDTGDLDKIMGELKLEKKIFKEGLAKPSELMHYCMLLDTLGDHEGMLNCALVHVEKTCSGGGTLRPADENLQRDMFAVACKKYMTSRLEMSRVLRDKKAHIEANTLGIRLQYINKYLQAFESELLEHIKNIITIIDQRLIPCCSVEENRVFYYKMLADYFRYSVDFIEGTNDAREYMHAVSEALANYKYAMELGKAHLAPTSPIFLAMVLNYSVFIYDMQNNVVGAIDCAEKVFNEAIKSMHTLDVSEHKESTLLLQLLRDNLQLWKHAAAVDSGDGDGGGGGLTQDDPEIEDED